MKHIQTVMVSLMLMTTFSCGVLKKSNRSAAGEEPVDVARSATSDDAIVAKEDPKASDSKIALTGKDLYGKLCASCHQAFDKTDVPKAQLNRIHAAIANVPNMASLKDTPIADLQAIAEALSEVSPGKGKGKAGEDEGTAD